jgi:hypothetical protein
VALSCLLPEGTTTRTYLIDTPHPNLSRGMRQLNGAYIQRFHRRHRTV